MLGRFPIVVKVKSTLGASNITRNYVIYNKTFYEFTDDNTKEYQDTLTIHVMVILTLLMKC